MFNIRIKAFVFFCLIFTIFLFQDLYSGVLGNRKITTVSQKKIAAIEKIVVRQFEQNYKSEDYDSIKETILSEVNSVFPVKPGSKIKKVNFKVIEKDCNERTLQKYPLTDEELNKKYEYEADQKFVAVQLNEEVNVKYKRGYTKVVKASGIYRGFNRFNNGIIIGRKTIPVFDLLPEDKVKFNKEYRELARERYIKDSIKKYLSEKEKYCVKLIGNTIDQIGKENEDAGYISAWRQWRTPDDITEMIFKYYQVEYMKKNKALQTQKDNSGVKSNSNIPKTNTNVKTAKPLVSGNNNIQGKANQQINTSGTGANKLANHIKKKAGAINEAVNGLE